MFYIAALSIKYNFINILTEPNKNILRCIFNCNCRKNSRIRVIEDPVYIPGGQGWKKRSEA